MGFFSAWSGCFCTALFGEEIDLNYSLIKAHQSQPLLGAGTIEVCLGSSCGGAGENRKQNERALFLSSRDPFEPPDHLSAGNGEK